MNSFQEIFYNIIYRGLEKYGKYYSIYPAYVYDNKDPQNMGRLRLIVPNVSGNEPFNAWAFSRNTYSGKDYGTHVIPEKNSLVWVEFLKGNPRVPIWSHGYFGEREITDTRLQSITSYWFQSPNKNRVEINDTEKEIVVQHQDGSSVVVSSDTIRVEHKDGKFFEISQDEIRMGDNNLEPIVLGNKLVSSLESLGQALQQLTVGTAFGPSSPPLNIAEITKWIAELQNILSRITKSS